jgi:hypothetical protein
MAIQDICGCKLVYTGFLKDSKTARLIWLPVHFNTVAPDGTVVIGSSGSSVATVRFGSVQTLILLNLELNLELNLRFGSGSVVVRTLNRTSKSHKLSYTL